jgi:hypothetical protein
MSIRYDHGCDDAGISNPLNARTQNTAASPLTLVYWFRYEMQNLVIISTANAFSSIKAAIPAAPKKEAVTSVSSTYYSYLNSNRKLRVIIDSSCPTMKVSQNWLYNISCSFY